MDKTDIFDSFLIKENNFIVIFFSILLLFILVIMQTKLTPKELNNIVSYKYKSTGLTTLDKIMTPFWNKIVSYFPLWVAPNLITVIGLMTLVIAQGLWFFNNSYSVI